MITLGIETSCDETSCAVLEGKHRIRSNVVSSSLFRHRPFGGIVPEIASRHCLEQIDFVFANALRQAGVRLKDIGLVAVTAGPGLIGSLLTGVCFGKALSRSLGVPLVGVHHLEAHISACFIGKKEPSRYVGLLVSGGHTVLLYSESGVWEVAGETVDDACGEAYDKTAKILGLGYPGGPRIEKLAKSGDPSVFRFTRPKQKNRFDFSFSGIKTAVLYLSQKHRITPRFQRDVAAGFQESVLSWLTEKAVGLASMKGVRHIIVGGGVSANARFRALLAGDAGKFGIKVWFPGPGLSGDNAAMIARRGIELYQKGISHGPDLSADPNLIMAAKQG